MMILFKKLRQDAKLPTYGSDYADCFDFYAPDTTVLAPHTTTIIKTGLIPVMPNQYQALHIFSRSGLSIKYGIVLANSVGIIDADYTNELLIALHNTTDSPYLVEAGTRVAQGRLVASNRTPIAEYVGEVLPLGNRVGGLGSTGK
jgi:dUTP pyrophosphatase